MLSKLFDTKLRSLVRPGSEGHHRGDPHHLVPGTDILILCPSGADHDIFSKTKGLVILLPVVLPGGIIGGFRYGDLLTANRYVCFHPFHLFQNRCLQSLDLCVAEIRIQIDGYCGSLRLFLRDQRHVHIHLLHFLFRKRYLVHDLRPREALFFQKFCQQIFSLH